MQECMGVQQKEGFSLIRRRRETSLIRDLYFEFYKICRSSKGREGERVFFKRGIFVQRMHGRMCLRQIIVYGKKFRLGPDYEGYSM